MKQVSCIRIVTQYVIILKSIGYVRLGHGLGHGQGKQPMLQLQTTKHHEILITCTILTRHTVSVTASVTAPFLVASRGQTPCTP